MMTIDRKRTLTVAVFAAGALVALGVGAGAAAGAGADAARSGIQETFDKAFAVMYRGGTAKEFTDAFYEDNVMTSGEGVKTHHGIAELFDELAADMPGEVKANCKMEIVGPVQHSGDLAGAFAHEHCDAVTQGMTARDARALFVLRHGPKGWRVIQELTVNGAF